MTIEFDGQNNKLGTTTADSVTIKTNDTNAITVDSNQNVGVGTTSPNKDGITKALTINSPIATNYSGIELSTADTLRTALISNSNGGYLYTATDIPLVFQTNNVERARFTSAGLHLGGTGSANALDDYEEGTWTPTAWGSGSITSATGNYVKIGKVVTVNARIDYGSTASNDAGGFQNLPFTVENSEGSRGGNVTYSTYGSGFYLQTISNSTRVVSYDLSGNNILNSGLSGDTVYFTATYYVA